MFWFDKFFEPVVVVSHTRKNYFDWALSYWAIKANVCKLIFGPPCISSIYSMIQNWNIKFKKPLLYWQS